MLKFTKAVYSTFHIENIFEQDPSHFLYLISENKAQVQNADI
jgi:hypothetical protein